MAEKTRRITATQNQTGTQGTCNTYCSRNGVYASRLTLPSNVRLCQ